MLIIRPSTQHLGKTCSEYDPLTQGNHHLGSSLSLFDSFIAHFIKSAVSFYFYFYKKDNGVNVIYGTKTYS